MKSKAQQCKQEIEYAISQWKRSGALGEPTPEIMIETSTAGFYLGAIPPDKSKEVILTWPSADLEITLTAAIELKAKGYREIIIYEDDFGVPLEDLTETIRSEILSVFAASGGQATFMELMEEHLDESAFF